VFYQVCVRESESLRNQSAILHLVSLRAHHQTTDGRLSLEYPLSLLLHDQAYQLQQDSVLEPGEHVRYPLPIVLPNDVLPELLRSARAYGITVEELILTMIEDYLEDCRRTPKSATFGKEPPK